MISKNTNPDVCFVIPTSAKKAYKELAITYSAIEPPTWAVLLAQSLKSKNFDSLILDFDADKKSLDDSIKLIIDTKARLIIFVLYGQNPNAGTTSMIGATRVGVDMQ